MYYLKRILMEMTIKYPQVQVRLVGEDGNAFAILGRVIKALKFAGVDGDEIKAFQTEAMTGDYNHLLRTCMAWVDTDTPEDNDEEWA
jgi:hypothetical protein